MIAALLPIARNAFIESVRQPVYLVIVLVSGILQIVNVWITGFTMGYRTVPGEVTADDKLLLDVSMATVFLCGMVLAAFIATATISREIENKTILTVVAKPIGRPSVIVGKWLGVCGAMTIAVGIMIAFLLLGIRHGVMTTAADVIDQPVVLFGVGAVFLCLGLAAVANFLYGWSFPQTSALLILPVVWVGYAIVLLYSKKWALQPITHDLKPQIMLACACLGVALLVMSTIAVAASTRMGQVMTIITCLIFFLGGLLSNYVVGRYVYDNHRFGQVSYAELTSTSDASVYNFHRDKSVPIAAALAGVTPDEFEKQGFDVGTYLSERDIIQMGPVDDDVWRELMLQEPGAEYRLILLGPPTQTIKVGDPIYYSASPNGVGMSVARFVPPDPATITPDTRTEEPALVITEVNDLAITIRQIGRTEAVPVQRPPLARDSLFLRPTRVNPVWLGVWGVVPNMQSFWLLDAITQAQPIPLSHVLRVLLYAVAQIVVFLSLAVLLFQGRDVG